MEPIVLKIKRDIAYLNLIVSIVYLFLVVRENNKNNHEPDAHSIQENTWLLCLDLLKLFFSFQINSLK